MTQARHRPRRSICPIFPILAAALALAMAGCHPAKDLIAGNPRTEEMEPFDPNKLQLSYALKLEQTLSLLKNNRDIMIVDVRTPEEFAASHLAGAYNYDAESEAFVAEIGEIDKGPKILIYGGDDAAKTDFAVVTMGALGFRNIYRLSDGIEVWIDAGHPVVHDIPPLVGPPLEASSGIPPADLAPPSDPASGEATDPIPVP